MTAKQTICAKQNSIIKAFVVLVPSGLASLLERRRGNGGGAIEQWIGSRSSMIKNKYNKYNI